MHAYTALGLLCAAVLVLLIARGTEESLRSSLFLFLLANVIDGTDGVLARKAQVKQVIPHFDGRRLDDLIDFLTYTFLPLFFLAQSHALAPYSPAFLMLPLLASAYGFCQVHAKTHDGYFLGFPSYWNWVALYIFLLKPAPWIALSVLMGLSVLTFVPTRYFYPSQSGRWNRLALYLCCLWGFWAVPLVVASAYSLENQIPGLVVSSLWYPAFYVFGSFVLHLSLPRRNASTR